MLYSSRYPFLRSREFLAALLICAGLSYSYADTPLSQNPPKSEDMIIKIAAQRFRYTPNIIRLKRGKPVILAFTSLDFTHGFSIPDLHLRADLPVNKTTSIRLTPEKTGTFDFLCDNFCGMNHEDMNGKIIVTDN
jgi:cytochrome c oxidase subunit II